MVRTTTRSSLIVSLMFFFKAVAHLESRGSTLIG